MALSKDEVMQMVNRFLESLRRRHDIREAYLFGSSVSGLAKDYSDVDLAIVLGALKKSEDSPFDEAFQIFHEAQEYNSILEVVCFSLEDFARNGGSLVRKIKREGIKVM
jgi:predicted nucleotidyltransferase